MMGRSRPETSEERSSDLPALIHRVVLVTLQIIMAVELGLLFYEMQWVNAFLVMMIMVITLLPAVLGRRFRVTIPPEFQVRGHPVHVCGAVPGGDSELLRAALVVGYRPAREFRTALGDIGLSACICAERE
jgi:hypothetical protein